jgi:hypothetical protein
MRTNQRTSKSRVINVIIISNLTQKSQQACPAQLCLDRVTRRWNIPLLCLLQCLTIGLCNAARSVARLGGRRQPRRPRFQGPTQRDMDCTVFVRLRVGLLRCSRAADSRLGISKRTSRCQTATAGEPAAQMWTPYLPRWGGGATCRLPSYGQANKALPYRCGTSHNSITLLTCIALYSREIAADM